MGLYIDISNFIFRIYDISHNYDNGVARRLMFQFKKMDLDIVLPRFMKLINLKLYSRHKKLYITENMKSVVILEYKRSRNKEISMRRFRYFGKIHFQKLCARSLIVNNNTYEISYCLKIINQTVIYFHAKVRPTILARHRNNFSTGRNEN